MVYASLPIHFVLFACQEHVAVDWNSIRTTMSWILYYSSSSTSRNTAAMQLLPFTSRMYWGSRGIETLFLKCNKWNVSTLTSNFNKHCRKQEKKPAACHNRIVSGAGLGRRAAGALQQCAAGQSGKQFPAQWQLRAVLLPLPLHYRDGCTRQPVVVPVPASKQDPALEWQ